ncbi:EFR1 family ferrodoxin [Ruminococcus flavefaciens]|uniref:EFR1 family ferrodoxin n=1 Tax=Ruminococcus flavefaciens TaxID=1265 RepID=UPI0002FA57B7|nr:EFR1 family ferrodoxin [Ruminococcus flavefaciens]
MIFYFTGTGNSLWAAKQLVKEDERLISIADARKKREYKYSVSDKENVGFVFPVYCYTLSDTVFDFVSKIQLTNAEYVYAVITCGGGIGGAGGFLKSELAQRGITLNAVFELLMPDNTVFYYKVTGKAEAEKRINNAEEKLKKIISIIERHGKREIGSGTLSKPMRKLYHIMNATKRFRVNDNCIGCGMCEKICPDSAVKLRDKKPVWIKSHCTKCSACINRCPKQAIQYGKGTEKRERYINPRLKGDFR